MPRAVIHLPDRFVFTTTLRVRIGDINYGNHLGNDSLLLLLQEARLRFLQQYGFTEKDVGGCGIIMADAVIIYKSQSFYGDRLQFEITAADFSSRACDLIYHVTREETGQEIARAKTRIAFFDYQAQKTTVVPTVFRRIFLDE